MIDIVVRGGTVVTADGQQRADIAIDGEGIAHVGPDLPGAREEIDAAGLTVMPAVIDVHLHFNEPGRTHWEGSASGSRALAAGGGTMFFDMPLNSSPCTVSAGDFSAKRSMLETTSITDFALWGGLVPNHVRDLAEMADLGAVGFKAFMCDSGLPEFPRADDATLLEGMAEAARLGRPVAVHAENEELTRGLLKRMRSGSARDFLRSRPVVAELEAIQRAIVLAAESGAKLHIVHVSSGRGVALAAEARSRGVDVSIETCPHYLYFTEDDVERLGTVLKCTPPLRSQADHDLLWAALLDGSVDIVASDHSPTEPALKEGDFRSAWGGIAGVQSTLAVLLEKGHHARAVPLERIVSLLATTPAQRFGISRKGSIAPGNDADLALVDPAATFILAREDLHQRHKMSPYVGSAFRGEVRRTIRRGQTIYADGAIAATGGGRFVRPA